jgi:hypothetical protein
MSWRALFERSELVRPHKTGVRPLHEARWGVTGFGHFCRNKSGSSAGTKPGKPSRNCKADERREK